jgi:diaminopimelate decarboxylase
MHDFQYYKSELRAENVPIRKIVRDVGTPVYVYSHRTLLRHVKSYHEAFKEYPHIICYALKANPNPAIIRMLAKLGCGADVVSGGELHTSLKAGIPASKIVYAGVGKTEDEITYALKSHILMFNVESSEELVTINKIAERLKLKAPIALRVNPDIDPKTHPYISTGLKKNKFGIPIEDALEHYRLAKGLSHVEILGIHKHIGSQITDTAPFVEALKKVLVLAETLRTNGINFKYLDVGGGLGIPYDNEDLPEPSDLSREILPLMKSANLNLILEPGRSITGNAGILVTRALYIKKTLEKEFVIIDAGMNDLLRPSLYNAFHNIIPVQNNRRRKNKVDIVGPVCESGDFIAKDRLLNRIDQGDLLAVMSAGAYGFSMSSHYNSRPRAAEVLVKGREFFVIRKREQYSDLDRRVKIPDFLK